jgi:hypothetical protein
MPAPTPARFCAPASTQFNAGRSRRAGRSDLTATANDIQGKTFRSFEAFLVVAAIYLGLTFVMRTGLTALERVLCRYKFVGR